VPCASASPLNENDIEASTHIVAQMCAEPFLAILQQHPDIDVIVAGRAYDPAPCAALCMRRGIDPGVYWHMGKIMECGGACAEPKGSVILASVREGSFDLEPMNPKERCTTLTSPLIRFMRRRDPTSCRGPVACSTSRRRRTSS